MRWLTTALPVVACLGMMLVMCVPMLMNRGKGANEVASSVDVAELREEIARLKAQKVRAGEKESLDG